MHLHRYRQVKNTGLHRYYQCRKCDKRKVSPPNPRVGNVLQPIDYGWIKTGKWTRPDLSAYTRKWK